MKIVDERKEGKRVPFKDLGIGDVFQWDDCVHMKVFSNIYSCNAIRFDDGRMTRFVNPDTKVFPLNAELVIRGEKNE